MSGSLAGPPATVPRRRAPDDGWSLTDLDQASIRTLIRPPAAPDGAPPHAPAIPQPDGPQPDGPPPDVSPPYVPQPDDPPRSAAGRSRLGLPARAVLAFDRRHLAVVVGVLTLAVLVGGWAVLRARDHAVGAEPVALDVATTAGTATPHPPGDAAPSTAATSTTPSPATVTVHVVGAVHDPGLVRLPDGSRVADAIRAAGGLLDDAVPGRLNLAQQLHDGEQVFVSDTAERPSEVVAADTANGSSGGTGASSSRTVNLNTATQEELETLPGVGPATAQAILAWRREHGRFTRIEELQEVDGIGPKTFARLSALVTV